MTKDEPKSLIRRARDLRLWGLVARWDEVEHEPWLQPLIETEEVARARRTQERRIQSARIGCFKPVADFDWKHPRKIDRALIEELFSFDFLDEPANVIMLGQNGVGKTMLAQNLAYQAAVKGRTVLFTTASEMLNELAAQEGAAAFKRKLRKYTNPEFLAVDELGYLSYDSRHADLLFEVVAQRYKEQASILVTTNRPFSEWSEIFPNATCVTTLIDRLCHRAEIVTIDGDSYRVKEAKDRSQKRRSGRRSARKPRASA